MSQAKPLPEDIAVQAEQPLEAPALAAPVTEPSLAQFQDRIDDRIDRLEKALTPLTQLDGLEERLFQRVTAYIEKARPEVAPPSVHVAEPSILGAAGKELLSAVVVPAVAAPAWPVQPRPPARPWAIREILAEFVAMVSMFFNRRYRFSRPGRVVPPVLLGLFLTTGWWVPYLSCGVGELFRKPVELFLCFILFKLLGIEARRYRETAPDLPSWLRL